ncbi:MAG TPA: zinc finger domain-containing protein, partial [Luteimonas sp.]|nr:zinc finger domain-containing protein [Luteimonas sp.]
LISGDVKVLPFDGAESRIIAAPTKKPKCVRCWHHRDDVGSHAAHPQLCGRCVSNVEGPGEDRRWF